MILIKKFEIFVIIYLDNILISIKNKSYTYIDAI